MEIVRLTREYARAAANVFVRSWRSAYKGIVPKDYLDKLTPEKWEERLIEDISGETTNFIVLDGTSCVGISSVAASRDKGDDGCGEIIAIYLLPEYSGKGIGAALIKWDMEYLESGGYNTACLWVLEKNDSARRFYERHGFMPTAQHKVIDIGGKPLGAIKYIAQLKTGT